MWSGVWAMVRHSNSVRASIEAEADPGFFLARVCTIYGYDYALHSVRVPNTQH